MSLEDEGITTAKPLPRSAFPLLVVYYHLNAQVSAAVQAIQNGRSQRERLDFGRGGTLVIEPEGDGFKATAVGPSVQCLATTAEQGVDDSFPFRQGNTEVTVTAAQVLASADE